MGNAKAKARIQGHITKEEMEEFITRALINSSDKDEFEKEINRERIRNGELPVKGGALNTMYKEMLKEKRKGIKDRFMREAVEYEKDKFVYAESNYNFKYRLINSGKLDPETEKKIEEACFKKWFNNFLEKYSSERFGTNLIMLFTDKFGPEGFIVFEYNNIDEIDPDIIESYKKMWKTYDNRAKSIIAKTIKWYSEENPEKYILPILLEEDRDREKTKKNELREVEQGDKWSKKRKKQKRKKT